MCKVSKSQGIEAAERQNFLFGLQQYGSQIQRGISVLLQIVQETNVRSDANLDDLANSLTEDNRVPVSADTIEKGVINHDISLVQGLGARTDEDSCTMDGQPVAMQGNHLFQEAEPFCHELAVYSFLLHCSLTNTSIEIEFDRLVSHPTSPGPTKSLMYKNPSLLLSLSTKTLL